MSGDSEVVAPPGPTVGDLARYVIDRKSVGGDSLLRDRSATLGDFPAEAAMQRGLVAILPGCAAEGTLGEDELGVGAALEECAGEAHEEDGVLVTDFTVLVKGGAFLGQSAVEVETWRPEDTRLLLYTGEVGGANTALFDGILAACAESIELPRGNPLLRGAHLRPFADDILPAIFTSYDAMISDGVPESKLQELALLILSSTVWLRYFRGKFSVGCRQAHLDNNGVRDPWLWRVADPNPLVKVALGRATKETLRQAWQFLGAAPVSKYNKPGGLFTLPLDPLNMPRDAPNRDVWLPVFQENAPLWEDEMAEESEKHK